MQFETFRGRNVEEALAAVRAALGPDAFIESTRHVSNGEKGWLGKSFVEVLAAPSERPSAGRANPFSRQTTERKSLASMPSRSRDSEKSSSNPAPHASPASNAAHQGVRGSRAE